MIDEKEVIDVTHYGSNIYAHVLREHYPNEIVLELKGLECKPTKNPFNQDKKTLFIWQEDGIFLYKDLELPDFKGNPFDFAYLHYGLTGQPLLEKIVSEMYLVVGQPKGAGKYYPGRIPHKWVDDDFPRFSFFYAPISNITPGPTITIHDLYRGIKSRKWQNRTDQLRLIKGVDHQRRYKAKYFDYVCISGIFSKRGDKFLVRHSGLMVIDFDHIDDVQLLKFTLLNDPFFETQLMFTSPSGHGLKWVVGIDLNLYSHLDWFNSIERYIKMKYNLEVDKSGKDISRACFLPYDPEVFIHPKYRC